MILFCNTSALLKLYLTETGSELVKQKLSEAEAVAVCRIAWAEAHAAFARRVRETPQDEEIIEMAKGALAMDWPRFVIIEVDQILVELASVYADTFALRAYDSVQLAAGHRTQQVASIQTVFACFDIRLNKAAKVLGLLAGAAIIA